MQSTKPWAVFGLACLCGTGCATTPRADTNGLADGQQLPILRERTGTFSAIDKRLRLVVHDPGTLAMLPVDPGQVDFDHEMVLVAALGPTASADYAVRITRVWRDGAVLRAEVEVAHPPADSPRRGIPASPYHLVVIPKSNLNVAGFTAAVSPEAFAGSGRRRGP